MRSISLPAFSNIQLQCVRCGLHTVSVNQTSVRHGGIEGSAAVDLEGLNRSERVAALRSRMAALGSEQAPEVEVTPDEGVVDVPSELVSVLPGGGLPRRQVMSLSNSPALAVEIISHVTSVGGHVAVVGWSELLLAQVVEQGDLSRVVAVPDPGADPWSITGVLVEGMDVVFHHGPPVELSPARARPILARVRGGQAALVTVDARLPGTALSMDANVVRYHGIGRGTGRIRGVDIAVRTEAKGKRPKSTTITCGQPSKNPRPKLRAV